MIKDQLFAEGVNLWTERRRIFFILTTDFIYGYVESDIWQRMIKIAREETCYHYYMGKENEMFYLMMHLADFIYSYIASDTG